MADNRRTSFDFRDDDLRGEEFQPAQPPSATATNLRNTTRSALAGAGAPAGSAVRRPAPQTPDRSPANVVYLGENPNDPVGKSQRNTSELFERARGTNDLADRSALLREAIASSQFDRSALDSRTTTTEGAARRQAAADIADLNAQVDTDIAGQRERTALELGALGSLDSRYGADTSAERSRLNSELQASTSRANNRDTVLGRALADQASNRLQAQGLNLREREFERGNAGSYTLNDHFDQVSNLGLQPGSPEELQSLKAAYTGARTEAEKAVILQMIRASGQASGQVPGGYQGGLVKPMGFEDGGIVPPGPAAPPALGPVTPQLPDPALIDKYTQYADGARAMGLTTVGFDEFAQMAQGAQATAGSAPAPTGAGAPTAMSGAGAPVQLAEGGEVPVAGKMVIDSDPNAPTDSIPAVIDGQTPAALDSGELVFPRHAVLYYGTDKLNKMIAKSQEAQEGGNGESATGLNG